MSYNMKPALLLLAVTALCSIPGVLPQNFKASRQKSRKSGRLEAGCHRQGELCPHEVEVHISPYPQLGDDVTMHCNFDLRGRGLYSVRWFKEEREFYRYVPSTAQPKHVFKDVAGVAVNMSTSDERVVQLTSVKIDSSGQYRCEVTREGPTFQYVSAEANMEVVAVPERSPSLEVSDEPRRSGNATEEYIRLNCTSDRSHPEADIKWIIGNRYAPEQLLERYPTTEYPDGRKAATLGVRFHRHYTQCTRPAVLTCVVVWPGTAAVNASGRPEHAPMHRSNASYTVPCLNRQSMEPDTLHQVLVAAGCVLLAAVLAVLAAGLWGWARRRGGRFQPSKPPTEGQRKVLL